jgi:hypothetical protein
MRYFRKFSWLYAVAVGCALVLALAVDLAMRNSAQEHMLPNLILLFVCAPLDIALMDCVDLLFPYAFSALGIGQLIVIAACGAMQSWLLLWLTRPGELPESLPNKSQERTREG